MTDDRKERMPELGVRDPVFGKPEVLSDGTYKIGATVIVTVNNKIAYGVSYQFLADGLPSGSPQLVSEGHASAVLKIPATKTAVTIAIELKANFGSRIISLREIDLVAEIKKDTGVQLEFLSILNEEKESIITLARVDEAGSGKKGKIIVIDPQVAKPRIEDTNDYGFAVITVSSGQKKRKVTFSPSEKPAAKIELEIPGKKSEQTQENKKQETEKPEESLFDRLKEAYNRGRCGKETKNG